MIAALFVEQGGVYSNLPNVEMWAQPERDARQYTGPHPVIAHPPCARWCRLAGLVEARWGYKRGEDGGCFASALANVRRCGGMLKHPAYSDAWPVFDLPRPASSGWTSDKRRRVSKCAASRTPLEFRDVLIAMASGSQ